MGNAVPWRYYKVALIMLVQLQIAAILFYRMRRNDNLAFPMLTGDKSLPQSFGVARTSRLRALLALGARASTVIGMVLWAD